MTRIAVVACIVCATLSASLAAEESPRERAVLETTAIDYVPDRGIVGLPVGRQGGVEIGDRFWVFDASGKIGTGVVFFTLPEKSAGKLDAPLPGIVAGTPATILRGSELQALRDELPPGVTIRSKVVRVPPGHHTAWINTAETAGLRSGDQLFVTRAGIPIARGRLALLEPDAALATLEPLVDNAIPEADDAIELWPAPADARWGRLNSTVLQVEDVRSKEGALLSIAGSAEDGLTEGRLVDITRGRSFVGVAVVVQVSSPLSKARMIPAATARELDARADVGDSAVVRASVGETPVPLVVPVLRVEEGYCLIGAGEVDGLQAGEKFVIRRPDEIDPTIRHEIAELTVQNIKVDFAGAAIRPLVPGAAVRQWDMAERRLAAGAWCQIIGIVESVDAPARTAEGGVGPLVRVPAGTVIRWVPEADRPAGGGVVLRQENDRLIFWVPPGWGAIEHLPRARIEAVEAALTQARSR